MTDHALNHITTTGTDYSAFITDLARKDTSIGQDHTTGLNVAEVPATTGGTHPTPHPTTATTHDTHPLKDTLGDNLTGTHHTDTTMTFL